MFTMKIALSQWAWRFERGASANLKGRKCEKKLKSKQSHGAFVKSAKIRTLMIVFSFHGRLWRWRIPVRFRGRSHYEVNGI